METETTTEKKDKREKQVKDRLLNAMIALSQQKEWTHITVTDLIHTSGVARASFYRNFESVGDLIQYCCKNTARIWVCYYPKTLDFYAVLRDI